MNLDEISELRKSSLAALAKKLGGNAALGRHLGYVDGAFIGQMISGKRPITEKTVLQAESLPGCAGWFSPTSDKQQSTKPGQVVEIDLINNSEQPTRASAAPSLADTLAQLGKVIAASDELTRDQLKPLFTRMLDEPQRAPEIIKRIESTISSSGGSASTTDVAHKEKPGFLK